MEKLSQKSLPKIQNFLRFSFIKSWNFLKSGQSVRLKWVSDLKFEFLGVTRLENPFWGHLEDFPGSKNIRKRFTTYLEGLQWVYWTVRRVCGRFAELFGSRLLHRDWKWADMVKHVTGDQSVSDGLRLDSTRSKTEPKLRINFLEFRKKILIFLKIGLGNVKFSKFSLSSNLTWISEKSD